MNPECPIAERVERSVRSRILQSALSFPTMLAGLLILLAVITVRARFDDPDMWWHLKTGEIIWTTHSVPATDTFSYTTGHHPYVAHEWLSQLLIYAAYKCGSYSGLMLWLCFFTSALLVIGYGLCRLYSKDAKLSFLGALLIWLFSTIGLAIRPQMIGYLLLVAEMSFLHLGRTRNRRWFYALPPLFAIWVNCHGSFFFGIIVVATFLISAFFEFQKGSLVAPYWDPTTRKTLSWAFALSVAALFLNPVGIRQILYPLDTLLYQPMGLSQVEEWRPLVLTDERGIALLAVLGCIFLLIMVRRTTMFWHELLLLILGTWLAVSHRRMLFVFGILVAPILSRLLSTAWGNYNSDSDKHRPVLNAIFIAASLLGVIWAFPRPQSLARQVEEHSPVKAVEFIKSNHLSGNMVNDYGYGGYLIWAAPEHPVFVDGRADVFEATGVLNEFGRWATLQSNPNDLLDKYQISFCLLPRQSPLVTVLPLLHNWQAAYTDEQSVIFTRVKPPNTK